MYTKCCFYTKTEPFQAEYRLTFAVPKFGFGRGTATNMEAGSGRSSGRAFLELFLEVTGGQCRGYFHHWLAGSRVDSTMSHNTNHKYNTQLQILRLLQNHTGTMHSDEIGLEMKRQPQSQDHDMRKEGSAAQPPHKCHFPSAMDEGQQVQDEKTRTETILIPGTRPGWHCFKDRHFHTVG